MGHPYNHGRGANPSALPLSVAIRAGAALLRLYQAGYGLDDEAASIQVNLLHHVLDGGHQHLPMGAAHQVNIVAAGEQYVGHLPQEVTPLSPYLQANDLEAIVLPRGEGGGLGAGDLEIAPSELLCLDDTIDRGQLYYKMALMRAHSFNGKGGAIEVDLSRWGEAFGEIGHYLDLDLAAGSPGGHDAAYHQELWLYQNLTPWPPLLLGEGG